MPNNEPRDNTNGLERAERFLIDLLNARRVYHHHKETMAYAATALYVLAFGTTLVSTNWPPEWFMERPAVRGASTVAAITVAWILLLAFVKWQLRLRRRATIEVAGTETLLASWIQTRPSTEDLQPWRQPDASPSGFWSALRRRVVGLIDWVWPVTIVTIRADVLYEAYPSAAVTEWVRQEESVGTGAIFHERLVIFVVWIFYLALLAPTLAWWL